jgi:hypothetical protein
MLHTAALIDGVAHPTDDPGVAALRPTAPATDRPATTPIRYLGAPPERWQYYQKKGGNIIKGFTLLPPVDRPLPQIVLHFWG